MTLKILYLNYLPNVRRQFEFEHKLIRTCSEYIYVICSIKFMRVNFAWFLMNFYSIFLNKNLLNLYINENLMCSLNYQKPISNTDIGRITAKSWDIS